MTVYRFRILLDHSEDILRDIEIDASASFMDFHEMIIKALGYSGLEMASFFMSNEDWDKGEEIALMDMAEPGQESVKAMSDTKLNEMVMEKGDKMLFVYDFLRMWIYYVELVAVLKTEEAGDLPKVVLAVGNPPNENAEPEMDMSDFDSYGDDDDYDDEFGDGSEFESLDDYPDL
ncbi:MAG: hypothetical protein ABR574_07655 [Cryomorphaceae bacterium]|nr:plasmid pRiA4b ORF-3 family protein [Flavobacteriales bacterium]